MIPAQAKMLLDFIRATEVSTPYPKAYDVVYGHNERKLTKPITDMTLSELIANQKGFSQSFGSSASGAYQFMRDTLIGLVSQFSLDMGAKFDGELQDFLGYKLLERRGYHGFMNGTISVEGFALGLAKEWASFPVLVETAGAHRNIVRGQSYYAGDNLNRALVRPERVEEVLTSALKYNPPLVQPKRGLFSCLARLFRLRSTHIC